MNSIRAIIFDLDGTLVDSLIDIADAMNRTLMHFNHPVHDYDAYKIFVGNGLKTLVYRCLPEDKKDEEHVEECLRHMMREYGKTYADKTHLYEGISEMLDQLSERGLKLAILSNKADELTQKICSQLLSQWNFEVIMGASERFPRKPEPDAALFIAKTMHIATENILYVGDTNVDMKTANAAGMFAVGVTWGFRTRKELEENDAKAIIETPLELIELLSSNYND